jgi:hypothetical protein
MGEVLTYFSDKKKLINLLLLLILILGVPVALKLVQQTQIFKSNAATPPIQFTPNQKCTSLRNGKLVAICTDLTVQLVSPLGGPTILAPSANPNPSSIAACTSETVTSSPPSPQSVGAQVSFTASAGGCSNPEYSWWIYSFASNSWTMLRDWGSGSYTWDTAGYPAGKYSFGASSRNQGSTKDYTGEAFSYPVYNLQ